MDLRWKLKRLLGGADSDEGRPVADPDGWDDLATSPAPEAEQLLAELAGRGIEGRRLPPGGPDDPDHPDDEVVLQVRHRDAADVRRSAREGELPLLARHLR